MTDSDYELVELPTQVYQKQASSFEFVEDLNVEKCEKCGVIKHGPLTCSEAEKELNSFSTKNDLTNLFLKLNKLYMLKNCSLCPECEAPVTKTIGCSQMTCSNCDTNFEFLRFNQMFFHRLEKRMPRQKYEHEQRMKLDLEKKTGRALGTMFWKGYTYDADDCNNPDYFCKKCCVDKASCTCEQIAKNIEGFAKLLPENTNFCLNCFSIGHENFHFEQRILHLKKRNDFLVEVFKEDNKSELAKLHKNINLGTCEACCLRPKAGTEEPFFISHPFFLEHFCKSSNCDVLLKKSRYDYCRRCWRQKKSEKSKRYEKKTNYIDIAYDEFDDFYPKGKKCINTRVSVINMFNLYLHSTRHGSFYSTIALQKFLDHKLLTRHWEAMKVV